MQNWIWVIIAVAFFYLMFRHGGCCGRHASRGEHPGPAGEGPGPGAAESRTREDASPVEEGEGSSRRPSGSCH